IYNIIYCFPIYIIYIFRHFIVGRKNPYTTDADINLQPLLPMDITAVTAADHQLLMLCFLAATTVGHQLQLLQANDHLARRLLVVKRMHPKSNVSRLLLLLVCEWNHQMFAGLWLQLRLFLVLMQRMSDPNYRTDPKIYKKHEIDLRTHTKEEINVCCYLRQGMSKTSR
ncbi:MAG: hypothetical protein Q8755_02865, partial [Candidatus Phytoplasma australasiaticum]|nr:hypothetical protein [Candidatus Phytoplasma australasiaticum]